MAKRIAQLFLLFCVGVPAARAYLVVLENGDRLTGMIVRSDQETLSFNSQYAGASGEGLAGEEFQFQYSSFGSLQQKMSVYPNLTDPGVFRVSFDTTADTRMNRWLSWQVSVSDRYLSNPVPGRKKNDILLTTGLRITFVPQVRGGTQ